MVSFREFVPPIAMPAVRRLKRLIAPEPARPSPSLFDGDGDLFRKIAGNAAVYFEYGMGLSTQWMLQNSSAVVHAVDTSKEWVDRTLAIAPSEARMRLNARWVDLGPVKHWGYPASYSHRRNFADYVKSIWDGGLSPDVVLIDGRFRVSCFLHTLLSGEPGTKVFFDDYAQRDQYHVVEEFVLPAERCGRQSMFVIPESLDRSAIEDTRDRFAYVMD